MKRILMFGFLVCAAMLFLYSCQKELSEESNLNNAAFSFHNDSTFSCFSDSIEPHGTYYDGVSAARDTNFVAIVVNVKKTGNYTIATDSVNGYYFSASGFFSKTGFDTLILAAKGTPILKQTNDFTLSDSLGVCSFSIDVQDSTGTGLGGVDTTSAPVDTSYQDSDPATDSSWHFTDSTNDKEYSGIMGKEGNSFVDSSGTYILTLAGVTADSSQTFGFQLYTTNPSITPGVYPITGKTSLGFVTIATQSIVFVSNETLINGTPSYSYIRIDSYDAATKHIKGVFHCWALNASAQFVLIEGSFNTYLP